MYEHIPYDHQLIFLSLNYDIDSSKGVGIRYDPSVNFLHDMTDRSAMERARYSPPWANTSIIGIAGGSGSGKTSLAIEIVSSLNVPWVVILSMVNFPIPHPTHPTKLAKLQPGLILQDLDA